VTITPDPVAAHPEITAAVAEGEHGGCPYSAAAAAE
jgi:hypothetical protein